MKPAGRSSVAQDTRRIGGLEMRRLPVPLLGLDTRRIGGLESIHWLSADNILDTRRIGGLENRGAGGSA